LKRLGVGDWGLGAGIAGWKLALLFVLTLAKGGFARVYEVRDPEGRRRAVKVVRKESIRTKKNKTKVSLGLLSAMDV
jgi:hypothetical protein